MSFAKCISGEPETFVSPASTTVAASRESHHNSTNNNSKKVVSPRQGTTTTTTSSSTPSASPIAVRSSKLKMSHFFGWNSKNPKTNTSGNHNNHSPSNLIKTAVTAATYRRGEKSFLDFHQQYAITKHLGEGSYSTVKQVTHRKKGGAYACKIVDKLSLSYVDRAALSQEVKVMTKVKHENIMALHQVIEDEAKCYLIMELAENGDLFDKIVKQGKFQEKEVQKIIAALVEALHYCHSNHIIHRDIKPENVLLSGENVKLCDFGFAKQLNHEQEQSVDSCGTPGYAAPEILDGKPYGVEVDIFSLGVVFYIMLCGYPPFPMKLAQLRNHRFNVRFPSKDWNKIDPQLKELISQMLHVNPMNRPRTADLRRHPWIQQGKMTLDQYRQVEIAQKQKEELAKKKKLAEDIRHQLTHMSSSNSSNAATFEVIKYGRSGPPHRTRLCLSKDGKTLSWQSKLVKRSLLRYQSWSIFKGTSSNSSPSSMDLDDKWKKSSTTTKKKLGNNHNDENDEVDSDADTDRESSRRSSTSRSTRMTSYEERRSEPAISGASSFTMVPSKPATTKRGLWWKAVLRRGISAEAGKDGKSGASSTPTTPLGTSSNTNTATIMVDGEKRKVSIATLSRSSRFSSAMSTSSYASEEEVDSQDESIKSNVLASSIDLSELTSVVIGPKCEIFNCNTTNSQAVKDSTTNGGAILSIMTKRRDLHLEFPNEETRDAFAYLIHKLHGETLLPLQLPAKASTPKQVD